MTESGRPMLSKYKLASWTLEPPSVDTIFHLTLLILTLILIILIIIFHENFCAAEGGVELRCLSSNSIYMIGI